jgi:hypothetical protein
MVKIVDLVGDEPVLPPHDASEGEDGGSTHQASSGPLLSSVKRGVSSVSEVARSTAYYTHQGLQSCNKLLWYITAAYVVVLLPLFHTASGESQQLTQEKATHLQEQREHQAAQQHPHNQLGAVPQGLNLSGI